MKIIAVTGPTASGKTAMATALARRLNGEIISADSRQVYRGLDIGSGKDLAEYGSGADRVPAHLLDIFDPEAEEPFTLADFMHLAKTAIRDISSRGKLPVICGGTGLYIHALIRGYTLPGGPADRVLRKERSALSTEELAGLRSEPPPDNSCERANPYRLMRKLEIESSAAKQAFDAGPLEGAEYLVLGAFRPRPEIRQRIEKRLDDRLHNGMLEETEYLHNQRGVSWEKLESFGLEYRYLSLHLQGKISFNDMRNELLTKIRQFAKRQDTWFRKMEREGVPIHWLPPEDICGAEQICRKFLENEEPLES